MKLRGTLAALVAGASAVLTAASAPAHATGPLVTDARGDSGLAGVYVKRLYDPSLDLTAADVALVGGDVVVSMSVADLRSGAPHADSVCGAACDGRRHFRFYWTRADGYELHVTAFETVDGAGQRWPELYVEGPGCALFCPVNGTWDLATDTITVVAPVDVLDRANPDHAALAAGDTFSDLRVTSSLDRTGSVMVSEDSAHGGSSTWTYTP